MRTQLIIVIAILAISSTVGLVANATWYEMEWVRKEIGNTTTQPVDTGRGDGRPGPAIEVPEEGTIQIDAVLEHLANGTAIFVDAREQNDFDESRLRGAVFVPASDIYQNVDNNLLATGALVTNTVIVYCGGGTCEASHNVADALRRDYQFENVLIYTNGWEEIESSGRFGDYIVVGAEP